MSTKKKVVKKSKGSKTTKRTDGLQIIQDMLAVVDQTWASDHTRPGLVMSRLKDKQYYVSITRYQGSSGTRVSMASSRNPTLYDAIKSVGEQLINNQDLIDRLRMSLRS